jgi:hypothetical protein
VFEQGEQPAQRVRVEFRQEQGGRWLVAGEDLVRHQRFADAFGANLVGGLAEGEGGGLRQAVGEQRDVVAGQRKIGFAQGNEITGNGAPALVEQLVEGVLAVGAGFARVRIVSIQR